MKKSSLVELERALDQINYLPNQFTIEQIEIESPQGFIGFEEADRYFLPKKESSSITDAQFLTTTFGKKRKDIMKVSEIVAGIHQD